MSDTGKTYRFAGFEFDAEQGRMFDAGSAEIPLRPKQLRMLSLLVRNAGRVIAKDELLAAVWPEVLVTEDSLTQCISELRRDLGDTTGSIIRTVPRRGYLFAAGDLATSNQPSREHPTGRSAPGSGKPSILVLPFTNLSDDPVQAYLSVGFSQDIATELSRFTHLAIESPRLAAHLPVEDPDPARAAKRLGNGHVVDGSVRRMDDRLRVSVRLSDAGTGTTIWSERYDSDLTQIFDLQDTIVASIAGAIEGKVVAAIAHDMRKRPTESWTAYDYLLQGREICDQYRLLEAIAYLRRAVEIDPGFVQAFGWLAIGLMQIYSESGTAELLDEADRAAEIALQLDRNEPLAHYANALTALWHRDFTRSGQHFDQAVALNPADSQLRCDRANWLRLCGCLEEALSEVNAAQAMNPFSPRWFEVIRGYVYFDLKRYDEAVREFQRLPDMGLLDLAYLAAAQALLGNGPAARLAYDKIEQYSGSSIFEVLPAMSPHQHEEHLDHLLSGLTMAAGLAARAS